MNKIKKTILIIFMIILTTIPIGCISKEDDKITPFVTEVNGTPIHPGTVNLTVGQVIKIEAVSLPSGNVVQYANGNINIPNADGFESTLTFNTGYKYTAWIIPESARGKTITIVVGYPDIHRFKNYSVVPINYFVNE